MSRSSEIQVRPSDPGEIDKVLNSDAVQKQLLAALPRHLTPAQIARQAITLLRSTPKLAECSQFSVLAGIFKAAELGLALSGPLGQAYLVPRWNSKLRCNEATFQIGYKGIFQLAYRSTLVKKIEMRTVYEKDELSIRLGTGSFLLHVPNLKESGEAIGYYTVVTLSDGTQDFEYMTKEQVTRHREKYSPAKGTDYSGWAKDFDAMAQKTTARRLGKRLPAATELQEALAEDERGEMGMVATSNFLSRQEVRQLEGPSKMDALADSIADSENGINDDLEEEDARRREAEEKGQVQ